MNEQDIELAKPWEWLGTEGWTFNRASDLQKFADLIRADEREACAKLCDRYTDSCSDHEAGTAMNIQDAIRERGKHD